MCWGKEGDGQAAFAHPAASKLWGTPHPAWAMRRWPALLIPALLLLSPADAARVVSPCAAIEGRVTTRSCARVSAEHCAVYFEQQAGLSLYCGPSADGRSCEAIGLAAHCSVGATLNRSRAVLVLLQQEVAALRSVGTAFQLEAVTSVMAEIFELGIVQDAALPLATAVQILTVAGDRASPWGWLDPPRTSTNVARALPSDQAVGMESVLLRAVETARASRTDKQPGWRRQIPAVSSIALEVSGGYFINRAAASAAGEPLHPEWLQRNG